MVMEVGYDLLMCVQVGVMHSHMFNHSLDLEKPPAKYKLY